MVHCSIPGIRKTAASIFGAAILALAASSASASTVDLTYKGASTTDKKTVYIENAPVAPIAKLVYAFGFRMVSSDNPLDEFLAWCLDIQSYLGRKDQANPYIMTDTPFSNSFGLGLDGRNRVQAVFDANFATLDATDGSEAAAFQVALWNAVYDTDWSATTGAFAVTGGVFIEGLADGFLARAQAYDGAKQYDLSFWESTPGANQVKRQNLVSVAPVPLPAAGLLMVGALGGLAALRRRKRAI